MNTINKINWLLACTLLIMSSCQTKEMSAEPDPIAQDVIFTFTAMSGEETQTKTLRKEDGAIWWSPSDEIKIFSGESSGRFISQNTEDSASSLFTGSFDALVSMESLSENGVIAFYPYSEDVTYDGESITFTLSPLQNGVAGTFDDDLFPCIAKSVNTDLHFYNICGGAKFTVSRDDIQTVTLKGNNGEYLAGKIKVSFDSDGLPVVEVVEGETEVIVSAPDGGTFEVGKEYYSIMLPNELTQGLTVIYNDKSVALYDEEENLLDKSFKVNNEINVNRSKFGVLAELDAKLLKIDMDSSIDFADAVMKEMCVNAFDTDGDGELSYNEAAAVTDLSKMTLTKKTFKSFNEFQYFTGLVNLPDNYFKGVAGMTSIILPCNILSIGSMAFEGCTKLKNIFIPENVNKIGVACFKDCSNLSRIYIPEGVTQIMYYTFYGCKNLISVILPNTLTAINYGAFRGCSKLANIQIPVNVALIGDHAFYECSSLTSVKIPEGISSVEDNTFGGCSNLSSVIFPEGLVTIGRFAFNNTKLESVVLPETLCEIKNDAFYNCIYLKKLFVKSEEPPILGLDALGYKNYYIVNRSVYVPSESLELYKIAEEWSKYADSIIGYDFGNDKVVE